MKFYIGNCLLVLCGFSAWAQSSTTVRTGIVRGVVISKNEQKPISGALVLVVGDTLQQQTDQDGRFQLEGVPVGYNSLYVDAEDFKDVLTESFLVTTSTPAEIRVELEQRTVTMDEVIVSASPFRPTTESPVSMRRIGTEEIDLTPGANRDISKVVQSSPGVLFIPTANP